MKSGANSEQIEAKERQNLLRQINPHFIFNTLATIRIITKINPDLAYDMIYDFSKYLRAVFEAFTNPGNISFREETEYVISYTNLERIRFGGNIMINMENEEKDFMIPPLSLQPIVENAIIHGLKKGKIKGTISIISRKTKSEYIIQIKDDGVGFDVEEYYKMEEDMGTKEGGLQRVKCRLEEMTGGKLEIDSRSGAGTIVTFHIPKIPKDK